MELMNFESSADWQWESLTTFAYGILTAVLVVIVGIVLFKLIDQGLKRIEKKKMISLPLIMVLRVILRWFIIIVVFLLVLQQMGVSVSSLWTMLSAVLAMVAIGFVAVWSVLSNALCTIMLLILKPFQVGDEIEIKEPAVDGPGLSGKVINFNLMYTTLQSDDPTSGNEFVLQIPNNVFFQKAILRQYGKKTVSLEKQLFEEESLLKENS